MYDKYRKGQEAVLRVQLRAAEKGWVVAMPTTEARYDMVLDDGARLYRAQIKYAARQEPRNPGSVTVDLRKETRNNGKKRTYSKEEIDVLLVFVPQIGQVLWVPPELFDGMGSLSFHLKPDGRKGCRQASDFCW